MSAVHLVVGPDEHGVVLHGTQVAAACGDRVLRVRPGDPWPALDDADVVHVPFTDGLFGRDPDAALARFVELSAHVAAAGAALSVTLHDVPHDDSPFQTRRTALYRDVVGAARGVVVNSRLELSLVDGLAAGVHSLRVAPLPVPDAPTPITTPTPPGATTVAVLGFVYPDRGYEDVIAALPPGAQVVALGRASDGHDDLVERYTQLAGGRWSMTGYLSDADLSARLAAAHVPVAPNRRVTASASVNTWIAHGRRPLVPDSPYGRELAADRPGAITLYDPDDRDGPGGLRRAVATAIADPATTWLAAGTRRGPTLAEVATVYREHLAACEPTGPVPVDGGWAVPGNRWDLLADRTAVPRVSVVIPYYDAPEPLARTLAALARQRHPHDRLEVLVADDGSPVPPDVTAAGDLEVRVVRQDDRGFRAAAARNLGAAAATGEVLVFLDADTVPDPDFVDRLARLPAVCPDAVTVGRRRHVDFGSRPPEPLPEPQWLRDAYAASSDLLDADGRSYRFVLSAVLAMSRPLFDELGGFDERFVGYGGEDWELAHRAWVAGAVLAHVPDAVARHDGPDWAGRAEAARPGAKDAETLALSLLLPDPVARGRGQWQPYPGIVLRAGSRSATELLAIARGAFATGADVGVWADEVHGAHTELLLADTRIRLGEPPADVLARARCVVEITGTGAVDLAGLPGLCAAAEERAEIVTPTLRVRSTRAFARARRWWPDDPDAWAVRLFGRHDRNAPPAGCDDLAGLLRRC